MAMPGTCDLRRWLEHWSRVAVKAYTSCRSVGRGSRVDWGWAYCGWCLRAAVKSLRSRECSACSAQLSCVTSG